MQLKNLMMAAVLATTATTTLSAAPVADLPDLRVEYRGWSIGSDGARQEISYAERLYRAQDQAWIEREVPAAAQKTHAHHKHGGLGHKHADVAGAPLWVQRAADGRLTVQLVDRHERRLIGIEAANYGNVGFSGSWPESYYLLDPADLPRLNAVGTAQAGVQRYETRQGERTIRVAWDIAGQYAREIVSEDPNGLHGRTIKATRITAPTPAPWAQLGGYSPRDYSDLLD
jgi:hypothetical protein